jgi:hypothetical protein
MGKWIIVLFAVALAINFSAPEDMASSPKNQIERDTTSQSDKNFSKAKATKPSIKAEITAETMKWRQVSKEYTDENCRDIYPNECYAVASNKMMKKDKDGAMLIALYLCSAGEMKGDQDPCNWFLMFGTPAGKVKHQLFKEICENGNRQACIAQVNKALYGKNPPTITWKEQFSVLNPLCEANYFPACSHLGLTASLKNTNEAQQIAISSLIKSCSTVAHDCLILSSLYRKKGDLLNSLDAKSRACTLDPKTCN